MQVKITAQDYTRVGGCGKKGRSLLEVILASVDVVRKEDHRARLYSRRWWWKENKITARGYTRVGGGGKR
jgi:hypothetical protein